MRKSSLLRMFQSALLAALVLVPFARAQAQSAPTGTGVKAYWCKSPNGVAALQLESCAPGTEVRPPEPLGPHGRVAPPPQVQREAGPAAPATPRAPAASKPATPPPEEAVAAPAGKPARSGLKQVLLWLFILLGLALGLGLVGRQLGQSFRRWALAGGVLWILLLLVKVVFF